LLGHCGHFETCTGLAYCASYAFCRGQALNQMTKMGVRTGPDCRSDVPGLLAAGLAQAGAANHFAGFHIGLCVGNGWVAGQSAVEDLDRVPAPKPDATAIDVSMQKVLRC
jgi:succinate dehydrogenase/fumarate reductase flavoprotein subunit